MTLIFATRPSALARWQTQWVIHALKNRYHGLECEEKIITTQGDKTLDRPLPEIGGKGLFTQELDSELLSGRVHCAVHSLKDLPVENPGGLVIGCIPARAEVRDALISARGYTLQTLPTNASVRTSSLRRAAQILTLRPDLNIESLRGNVDTRVRKAMDGQYDAIILAGAGLTRLGLETHLTEWLDLDVMMPAPGQGALAVQCRADDRTTLNLLAALDGFRTIYVDRIRNQSIVGLVLGVGSSLPAHCTALGKVLLAGLSLNDLNRLLAVNELKAYTPKTLRTRKSLLAELEEIRRRGFAIDNEELASSLRAVAAPLAKSSRINSMLRRVPTM